MTSDHDPLCPRSQPPNDHPWGCCCKLIRRVREDERGKHWFFSEEVERQRGYAAAVHDAVEAVKAWQIANGYKPEAEGRHVIAAIEALGGER